MQEAGGGKEEERAPPDLLVILEDKDFEFTNTEGKGFLSAKIGNTISHAKVYKRRYDNLSTGKKVLTTLGGPIVSTGIGLKASVEKAKPMAVELESQIPGVRCFCEGDAEGFAERKIPLVNLTVEDKSWHRGIVFKQHPKRIGGYIQMTKFHEFIIQDKMEEFLKVMTEIGMNCMHAEEVPKMNNLNYLFRSQVY